MTPWIEAFVALLLVASGVLALIAALGLLRLKDFFQRLHAPAVISTLGVWCVALAAILYFSASESRLELKVWLIVAFMAVTAPITTSLLARAAIFRQRPLARDHAADDRAEAEAEST